MKRLHASEAQNSASREKEDMVFFTLLVFVAAESRCVWQPGRQGIDRNGCRCRLSDGWFSQFLPSSMSTLVLLPQWMKVCYTHTPTFMCCNTCTLAFCPDTSVPACHTFSVPPFHTVSVPAYHTCSVPACQRVSVPACHTVSVPPFHTVHCCVVLLERLLSLSLSLCMLAQ